MRIYFCHSKEFDYEEGLYRPIRESILSSQHEIFFPHEDALKTMKTRELIQSCDLVFAEVSFPATGMGVELGWADAFDVPIVCFFRSGAKVSGSLRFISGHFIEYADAEELVENIESFLQTMDGDR